MNVLIQSLSVQSYMHYCYHSIQSIPCNMSSAQNDVYLKKASRQQVGHRCQAPGATRPQVICPPHTPTLHPDGSNTWKNSFLIKIQRNGSCALICSSARGQERWEIQVWASVDTKTSSSENVPGGSVVPHLAFTFSFYIIQLPSLTSP